jgi:hypothetical protein
MKYAEKLEKDMMEKEKVQQTIEECELDKGDVIDLLL